MRSLLSKLPQRLQIRLSENLDSRDSKYVAELGEGHGTSTRHGRRLHFWLVTAPQIRGRSDAFNARQPGSSVLSVSGYPAEEIWPQIPLRFGESSKRWGEIPHV